MTNLYRAVGLGAMLALMLAGVSFANEARELTWDDLIPEGEAPPPPPSPIHLVEEDDLVEDDSWDDKSFDDELLTPAYTPGVVDELNGIQAKLPGFVVPLELSGEGKVKEFLLVPYFGACIHYPPPPSNQIVYVTLDEPVEIESPWDPIWAIGQLKTEAFESDLAAASYTMAARLIEEYIY